jgi:RNA polymerase sigma factor (sigma-70 family)
MLPVESRVDPNKGRKPTPLAKLPAAEVLATLSCDDLRRLRRILNEPAECIGHAAFSHPVLCSTLAQSIARCQACGQFEDDEASLKKACAEQPLVRSLKFDHERWLFVRFNFCRHQACAILDQFVGRRLTAQATRELLDWERAAHELRSRIVRENIALVLAMVKRTRITGVDPSDLVSEGNLALLRAANKFDCSRGYRFSTYACRAILKSFSRVATRTHRYRLRFPAEYDPAMDTGEPAALKRSQVEEDCVEKLRAALEREIGNLSDVERTVIRARFALDADPAREVAKGRTLEQVGAMIGVTKERVRQIQNKALRKLRLYLNQAVLA